MRVLIVAGTHGNERNAPWLQSYWRRQPEELSIDGLEVVHLIGNPPAYSQNRRYIDRDLNRSFRSDLLDDSANQEWELQRARQLLALHGPQGAQPAAVLIDLHSTTAAMGSCLVIYGDRVEDLALAAACQGALGLPVYLHGSDANQDGFMAKAWPCGLVLEVGPVAQGVICPRICQQTGIGVHTLLELLAQARFGKLNLPNFLKVHRHLGSLDLPKDLEGNPIACLHPDRLKGDWQSLKSGDPLFVRPDGIVHLFKADSADQFRTVFTNEAAYQEKNIALSLTRIEKIKTQPEWLMALKALLQG
jgi:aspartoacylase